jgi:hypothetical protein
LEIQVNEPTLPFVVLEVDKRMPRLDIYVLSILLGALTRAGGYGEPVAFFQMRDIKSALLAA